MYNTHMKVQLFYKQDCLYCKLLENFLIKRNIEYEKIYSEIPGVPLLKINNQIVKGPYTTQKLKRIFGICK